MPIVQAEGRPALDVVDGSYAPPEPPWDHLDDPAVRARLEPAIAGVGRVDVTGHPTRSFLGTAFAVGPDLLLTMALSELTRQPGRLPRGLSVTVDFGHELEPSEWLEAQVEAVVRVDERFGFELVRAQLPPGVAPLRLATAAPADLAGREVALVGYPAADGRNDATLVRRIFRGALEVKRMLPGRMLGTAEHDEGLPVLVHDCSTAAGCGGAPVVDVLTGEVVGVHFAGRFLEWNHAVPAWLLQTDPGPALPPAMAPAPAPAGAPPAPAPPAPAPPAPGPPPVDAGPPPDEPPPPDGVSALPAYDARGLLGGDRPAVPAATWQEAVDDAWSEVLAPRARRLEIAIRAVGKVLTGAGPGAWAGSAFLVGDRLAVTASFVAEPFADGAGANVGLLPGRTPAVDFSDALRVPPGSATAPVTGIRFIHPCFHVALLELGELPPGVARLELAAQLPSQLSGRLVALVAYSGDADGLLIQPGQALQVGEIPGDTRLPALAHDCANAVGSAGAPVIDLGTGYVIGVHTHGKQPAGGFAQPMWELARDPHVWAHAIDFRPDPRPGWLAAWDAPEAKPPPLVAPAPDAPPNGRWTVDEVPITWARPEPKALEQLLVATVQGDMAIYLAENVGLPIGLVNTQAPGALLWRSLLNTAAAAGLLRLLLEEIATAPQHAGIAPKLRSYL